MNTGHFPDKLTERISALLMPQHYYGDIVRRLFLAAGMIILILTPVYPILPIDSMLVILGVLAFATLGGLTNPKQRWVSVFDVIVAILSLIVFESLLLNSYGALPESFDILFIIRQSLAVLFFFALYYSVKTVRGFSVR